MQIVRDNSPEAEKELRRWILEGEHVSQDFKFAINNSKKIAITLSAFANTEGGRLLIGVKDNGRIAGIHPEDELHMLEGASDLYCRPQLSLDVKVIELAEGKDVLSVWVEPHQKDFIQAFNPEGDWRAYVREEDENFIASPLHLELWKREKKKPLRDPSTFGEDEKELLQLLATKEEWRLNSFARASKLPRGKVIQRLGDFLYWGLAELVRTENEYRFRSR
jgi:predicted HTH transcriptional regulator